MIFIAFLSVSVFGQAVITLVMPVGTRQLGMGETAVAVADDVFATYWNPAGLAFGPLSDEWELALSGSKRDSLMHEFTSLGSKEKQGFLSRSTLWSGARDGLYHFDGKVWKRYYEYVLEQEDTIEKVVRNYISSEENIDSLIQRVKDFNGVKSKEGEEELITLKLPYNLMFSNHNIRVLILDKSQRLWVGTDSGLFRYDGTMWKSFQNHETFAGNPAALRITALALEGGEIWIGTEGGLFRYRKTRFVQRGAGLLPTQHITALASHPKSDEIYVALKDKGVARYTPAKAKGLKAKWKLYGMEDGLLDSSVNNLILDAYGHLWVGHSGGISHFSLIDWQRITFNNQTVHSLDISDEGSIWIGTNKGVWKHTPAYTTAKGRKSKEKKPESDSQSPQEAGKKGDWFHYHTGNALSDNNDLVIETQGDDVWFVTQAGVERYNAAKSQLGLFYESLLPALDIEDLFHVFAGATFPLQEWGTVGGFVNFISFGDIPITNEFEEETINFTANEMVAALSYGTKLTKRTGLGLNIKFILSRLAPERTASGEEQDGTAASYAADLALLWKDIMLNGLNFGFVMQNIGPAVFYVDQDQSDPIPFTWKVGTSYEVFSTPNHKLLVAADANREAVFFESNRRGAVPVYIGAWKDLIYPYGVDTPEQRDHDAGEVWRENLRKTVFNTGMEYTYANVVSLRTGYLFDRAGEREELDLGAGFAISDVMQLDAAFIKDLGGGIRNDQKRFGLVFKF